MVNYRKILEMHFQGTSQRTIAAGTGHSRDKIREVVLEATARSLHELTDEMSNPWLEDYLFPRNDVSQRGYLEPNWDDVPKELLKKHVTLKLLHHEYEQQARFDNKAPYA